MSRLIVPLTDEIVFDWYGELPKYSMRGVAAMKDGRLVGLGGFFRIDTRYMLFSEMTDELRKDKRLLVMALRRINDIREELRLPVQSFEQPDIPGADVLLDHIGFHRSGALEGLWQA